MAGSASNLSAVLNRIPSKETTSLYQDIGRRFELAIGFDKQSLSEEKEESGFP